MLGNYNYSAKKQEASPAVMMASSDGTSSLDIMQAVLKRKLQGVMIHDDMMCCMEYLNFHGFKCEQKYRTMSEFKEFRHLSKYIINHYGVMPDKNADPIEVNPLNIQSATDRMGISNEQKKQIVKMLFELWESWERDTIHLLELHVAKLEELDKMVDADKVRELLVDTTKEYKYLERQIIEYNNVDWGFHHLYIIQPRIKAHFKEKMERD